MTLTHQIAKHLRDVYFGGNWTDSNLKDNLTDLTWQQANTQIHGCNSITTLVHHLHYYVKSVTKVLHGEPLNSKDALSFQHTPITSQAAWDLLLETTWKEASTFAKLIEQLPDSILLEDFTHSRYGNYFRNLHGILEHHHYHLGQIVVLKKIILALDHQEME